MTWLSDFIAWSLEHLGLGSGIWTFLDTGTGGYISAIGQALVQVLTILLALAPYFPAFLILFFIDILITFANTGDVRPIGEFVMGAVTILIGISEALATAIDAIIPL